MIHKTLRIHLGDKRNSGSSGMHLVPKRTSIVWFDIQNSIFEKITNDCHFTSNQLGIKTLIDFFLREINGIIAMEYDPIALTRAIDPKKTYKQKLYS